MAVEFYSVADKKRIEILFSLIHSDFKLLQNTLLKFKKLTAIFIDEYGRTRITIGHVKLIVQLLETEVEDAISRRIPIDDRLSVILEKFKAISCDVIAEGD